MRVPQGLNKSEDLVFLLAASNLPWELDPAMLRRLEKRILVDLPTAGARESMFRHSLPERVLEGDAGSGAFELRTDLAYAELAAATEGYSGSDIRLVCKEAAMRSLRKVFVLLEDLDPKDPASARSIRLDPVTTADVLATISTTKPSARTLQGKYRSWQAEYESL